jgi:hypothetical protein
MIQKTLLVFSYGFRTVLSHIHDEYNDKIAHDLLKLHKTTSNIISYIDVSSDIEMVTFITSNKSLPFILEQGVDPLSEQIYNIKNAWINYRQPIKIGRILKNFLQLSNYNQIDIENFVNRYKSELKKDIEGIKWDRVDGLEFNKWYLKSNYVHGGGTLNRSCLRRKERNKFINFLSNNSKHCRLLIMTNNNNKLLGRALLWKTSNPDRIFMDRIYTRFDEDVNIFIGLAKSRGWLYKSKQTYGGDIPIIDGRTNESSILNIIINDFKKRNFKGYPYLDTFQFYNPEKEILTNNVNVFTSDNNYIKLNKIDGSYSTFDENNEDDMLD